MITGKDSKRQDNSAQQDNLFAALKNLPPVFRETANWVCWRFQEVDGKQKKIPTNRNGLPVSVTDPKNFMTFDNALAALRDNNANLDGIGFAMTPETGLCCIDLDHCFTEDGQLLTHAWMVLKDIDPTYVERSPSGQGLHVWTKAALPDGAGGRRFRTPDGAEVEAYAHGRYMTMTGNRFECAGYPHHPQVEERGEQVAAVIARLEQTRNGPAGPTPAQRPASPPPVDGAKTPPAPSSGDAWHTVALDYGPLTDEDRRLLANIERHSQWQKIGPLWHGDLSEHDGDESRADMALAAHLAWWSMYDSTRLCRLFTASALGKRVKWRREDYAKRTIWRALQTTTAPPPGDFGPIPPDDAPPPGEPPPYLADTARAAWEAQQAQAALETEAARRTHIEEIKNGFWERRVSPKFSVENEPPPRGHILQGYIAERIVCAFSGAGGGGKSYQCLKFGLAITSGKTIEAFTAPEKGPVIYLSAEDDEGILWWRMHHLAAQYGLSAYEVDEMERNFHPIDAGGFFKAFMEYDRNGNPRESIHSEALREIIAEVDPALVIIDPKSDFYGIKENANEDEAAWTANLKSMVQPGKRTSFLVVSHIAKGLDEDQRESAEAARGGTAFVNACRTALNYVPARASEIKKYDLPKDAYKLLMTKCNYHKFAEPAFFVKDENGVPVMVDLEGIKTAKATAAYEDAVRAVPAIAQAWQDKGRKLNKRDWSRRLGEDLTDPAKPKPGPEQIAHDALAKFGIAFDQVETAIAEAIRRGYVKTVEGERTAKRGPAPTVIEFAEYPPDIDE